VRSTDDLRPTVSIVVPTHRRVEPLRTTIGALSTVNYPRDRYEIIVVDDAADEATAALIQELNEEAPVSMRLVGSSRPGAAAARNEGARQAGGDFLIFCDDDMIVDEDHLSQHLGAHTRFGECLVGAEWEFAPDAIRVMRETPFGRYRIQIEQDFKRSRSPRSWIDGSSGEVDQLSACNLSLDRELFWRLGGFDEDFHASVEDQEFCERAERAGCKMIRSHEIRLWHNDERRTLREYCLREERGAEGVAALALKYPNKYSAEPYIRENGFIERQDSPRLVAKKIVKSVLGWAPLLAAFHKAVEVIERSSVPEPRIQRLYATAVGVHMFRGFRRGMKGAGVKSARMSGPGIPSRCGRRARASTSDGGSAR
jgi:GT2 family glycosyltransferase